MLFLMRSAICIGLVASALPDQPPIRSSAADAAATGTAALAGLCRMDAAACRSLAAIVAPDTILPQARKLRSQPAAETLRLSRPAAVL